MPTKLPEDLKIAVLGLGYVGLPLALSFSRHFPVTGFDISEEKINSLKSFKDPSNEVAETDLKKSKIRLSADSKDISDANVYIVTVPTPVDSNKRPNLNPIINASELIGKHLQEDNLVIYESTVFPGATEEICVPVLEKVSGLKFNKDFFCGYSPERINPSDKVHTLEKIVKVTSGSTKEIGEIVDLLYSKIIQAGTFKAESIKVAEAAKVIENTQRDLNIALMNELSMIFNRLDIDTQAVLEAASTKWNFLNFKPGLVGGHCIGVDPYYLTHKAQELNYHPQVILSGRKINDDMPSYVAKEIVKKIHNNGSRRVLILGVTFKENCSDVRNSKTLDLIKSLREFNLEVDVIDPLVDQKDIGDLYNANFSGSLLKPSDYSAIVLSVPHEKFTSYTSSELKKLSSSQSVVFFDLKGIYKKNESDFRL